MPAWHKNLNTDKILAPTKYCHRQNIVVSTQYWRQLKIGINKILASTKHWHRQNIGVDKILALTKDWRWQNIGTCVEAYPYCFGPAKSAAADFSQTLLMFSCTSPWRCWTLHLQSQSVLLPLAATLCLRLSPTLYRPICWKEKTPEKPASASGGF
jgi:hypothetical protein